MDVRGSCREWGLVCEREEEEYTLVTAVSEICFIVRVDSFGFCPVEGVLLLESRTEETVCTHI